MIKIIYIEPKSQLYYSQLLNAFHESEKFQIVNDNQSYIFMGPGFLCDGALEHNEKLDLKNFKTCLFLNKEYKNLERKLDFINKNEVNHVFTVHHNYKIWNKRCPKTKFYKIPFAYNPEIFKDYGIKKEIDIGFTGNLFNKGVYKNTDMMGENFNNVRERISKVLKKDDLKKYNIFFGGGVYLHGQEYGKKIASSKMWICTPSAIDIIGPRYYEILGSNTLLFCKNLPNVYDGLFKDGIHYVGFDDDLSDFEEKMIFYLKNEEERVKISKQGHQLAIEKHTWKHRVDRIYEILRGEQDG